MTLLNKIDSVLECLYIHSGENPNFPDIERYLQGKQIDTGEIRDCLIKLKSEGYIYCEGGGDMNRPYSDFSHYLISFEGKFFWETIGGYQNKITNTNAENNRVRTLENSQLQLSKALNRLTLWIVIGTLVGAGASVIAAIYYVIQIYCS